MDNKNPTTLKWIYPEEINDSLARKKYRQSLRSKLKKLESNLEKALIKGKDSTEYTKASKKLKKFHKKHL